MSASTGVNSSGFWENLWRTSGLQFAVFYVIAYVIYGYQPGVGASGDALAAFYGGDRTRILIGTFFFSLNILNLLWFTAALRTALAEAGQDGWGAAATQKPVHNSVFGASVPVAAWKTIPSWYLVSQDDRAINPELERFYAKRMNANTSEVKASHVAFISHPDVVAKLIEQAAAAAAK